MKKTLTSALLLVSFLLLFCPIVNCAEDNEKTQSSQKTQQTLLKPILPPLVPNPLPGISPTPSLDIAAPPLMPNAIDAQKINADNHLRKLQPSMPTLPKLPTNSLSKSVSSQPILATKIQLIKSLLGKVINIGLEKDEVKRIGVQNQFFNKTENINVDSKKTRVMKKGIYLSLKDIKAGDTIRVIFNQAGKDIPVNVIVILTEEELKVMTQPK